MILQSIWLTPRVYQLLLNKITKLRIHYHFSIHHILVPSQFNDIINSYRSRIASITDGWCTPIYQSFVVCIRSVRTCMSSKVNVILDGGVYAGHVCQ